VKLEDEWVGPDGGEIIGIVVTPDDVIVPVGSEVQLEALGLNGDRQTLDLTDAVEWTSSASAIADISNDMSEEGVLRGVSAGTSVIVADFNGLESAPSR
jgi:cysteine synthase